MFGRLCLQTFSCNIFFELLSFGIADPQRQHSKNAEGAIDQSPSDRYAAKMASELGVSADKPLALFVGTNPDRARVNRVFVMGYLRRLSRDELSVNGAPRVWAREAIIDRGIQREYNDKLKGLLKARRPAAAGT